VRGRRVVDGWAVQCGFCRDCVGGYAGEFVLLVDAKDVTKESVVGLCRLTPRVSDVLDLALVPALNLIVS
jgi:hypothetical protein